jgi:hypothetical protein
MTVENFDDLFFFFHRHPDVLVIVRIEHEIRCSEPLRRNAARPDA